MDRTEEEAFVIKESNYPRINTKPLEKRRDTNEKVLCFV
jgi:hypothetical protein